MVRNLMAPKTISIVTPCFNEEGNVEELYRRIRAVIEGIGRYRYEHIFIDNSSTDRTVAILQDDRQPRSQREGDRQRPQLRPYPLADHAVYQARGDAVIGIVVRPPGSARDDRRDAARVGERATRWSSPSSAPAKRTGLMFWARKRTTA